jgi:hypothetical protein
VQRIETEGVGVIRLKGRSQIVVMVEESRKVKVRRVFQGGGGMHNENNLFGSE